jgi:hypothetical protein
MDALEYIKALRIAPDGTRLNTTQKLCLLLLALSLDEEGKATPSKDALADEALVNTRSIKRNLGELEAMRLIRAIPNYTETGQDAPTSYLILDEQGQSVTRNTLERGRVLPMTGQSVTGRKQSVTGNTLAEPNRINNLTPGSFGTKLAVLPPPPNSNNGGGLTPASALWAEIMQPYGVSLSPEGAELIRSKEPHNLKAWEETLRGWLASAWAKTNIDGQLDRYYKHTLKRPEHLGVGNNPPPSASPQDQEELTRRKKLVYGDE